ncbi:hypothetical protein L1987_04113 [Smallanthus sonchifolius]|uniref:Uncharacterized protein n=1 Tax=Smallanthus sonchifolius TaxID=185202 RepID=A0ACB9KCE5_9ASTR|nr:hypothetical protein L1987_04113 [Smallanthus sonchifolius]
METLLTLNPLKPQPRLFEFPNSRICSRISNRRCLISPISCKLSSQPSKDTTQNKVVVPGVAPSLSEKNEPPSAEDSRPKKTGGVVIKRLTKRILAFLANLPLALGEMFTIAALMALGTAIDQASLMACTYTTQIPMVKVARRWSFLHSANTIRKLEFSDSLPKASIQDLGVILSGAGYEVFLKGPSLYAFKGLAGRFAPIGVHLALLLIMGGGTSSATGSFKGSVTVPQGLNFVMGDVLGPNGFLSTPTEAFNTEVHVNRFYMDYYDSGEVSQFHTDLSLFDIDGKEVMRKTISVNDPLRYEGVTIYQTDWSISALQILKDDEGPFNLAVAPLTINGDKKLYGSFLPVGNADTPNVKGISMLLRDLQSVVLYDQDGKFVGVRRPGSKLPIEINGTKIEIMDAIGSSGLDMKTDPDVPIVYAGFGALMLTTCISYLSHTQIWALQDGTTVVVGGKTNRAKIEFPDEMNSLLDRVPEINEPTDVICG